MTLSEEKLKEIEDWAYDLMSMEEIAVIIGMPGEDVWLDMSALVAFQKGQLKALAGIRRSIRKLAEAGSGPAQVMALNLLENETLKKSFS